MAEVLKRTTCGETTTVVYKTRPKWYVAGQRFMYGAGAVIISSVITYILANIGHWIPTQYEAISTSVLVPFLLYARKYFSEMQEEKLTERDPVCEETPTEDITDQQQDN